MILLLEHRADDVALIQLAFERSSFHDKLQAIDNSADALRYLEGEGVYEDRESFPFPQLILLNQRITGDGWEVLRWVRRQAGLSTLPVVVLSGSQDPDQERLAMELGANAYHIKPQAFDELLELVELIGKFWLMRDGVSQTSSSI